MNRTEIKHIINGNFKKLKKYLRPLKTYPDKENIHEFRLQVKKMRAFLRLLSIEEGIYKPLKIPKELKKLYVRTGCIRDLQLLDYRIMHEFEFAGQVSQYHKLLNKSTGRNIARAKKLLKATTLSTSKKKIIREIPEMLHPKTIDQFFRKKQEAIRELLNSAVFTDPILHSIRKIIKDIIFLVKITGETRLAYGVFWNGSEIEKAESIAHQLGLFNDNCIALSMLEHKRLSGINLEEVSLLQGLYSQLQKENCRFKQDFQCETFQNVLMMLFRIG